MSLSRRALLKSVSMVTMGAAINPRAHAGIVTSHNPRGPHEAIRVEIAAAVDSGRATGVSVALTHRGRIIWEEGFGWANRDRHIKATQHTPFCLASITKPFTATALMTLVASNQLALDSPANRYFSGDGLRSLVGDAEGATIRLLGGHCAGLPRMFEMFPADHSRSIQIAALLKDHGTLVYAPNSIYEYSNIGYAVLGEIASRVCGMSFGALLRKRVLTPLGLRDSFFDTEMGKLSKGAERYDELQRPIPYYVTATPASGELYASAHDLARYAMFNLKTPLPDQVNILSNDLIDEHHKPILKGPRGAATAFGWFTGITRSGMQVVFKDGGQPGVSTILYILPSKGVSCAVLTNRTDNGEWAQALADKMIATIVPEWTSPDFSVGTDRTRLVEPAEFAGQWQGVLVREGIELPASLSICSNETATVSLSGHPLAVIANLQREGSALVGKATGTIQSPNFGNDAETSVYLKLVPNSHGLAGRVLMVSERPGMLNSSPYAMSLSKL